MKKVKKVVILGAGGNARDIIDTIGDINRTNGPTLECFGILDDDKELLGKEIMDVKVIGSIIDAKSYFDLFFINGIYSVINFFNNESILERSKIPLDKFETIIHPSASISQTAKIGKGCFLSRNTSLLSNVELGNHVTIHPGAVISHDTKIGDYSFVANTASVGGYVKINNSCFLGSNSSIKDRITVGEYVIIGMGSIVLKDIPSNSIYVGNPARFLRKSR